MFSFRLAMQKQQTFIRKGLYALIILILGLSLQPPFPVQASSTIFNDDFENGFSNWVMSGLWNPESESNLCGGLHAPFPSPTNAAYYGDDSTCTYNTGRLNVGNLTMGSQVSLPPPAEGRTARLTFWSFGNTNTSGFSTLRMVLISIDGGRNWNYLGLDQTEDAWNQHIFNLTPYLGKNVMIRFMFFSLDFFSHTNKFGWMIDNVSITESDPPVAQDDVYVTDEDTLLIIAAPGVLSNDTDPNGDSVSVTASDPVSAAGASVTVNPDGSFSYDPRSVAAFQTLPEGSALGDTFKYTATYGSGGSTQATVHITVNGRNDPPVLQPVSNQTIAEETQVAFTALATDIDSTVLTFSLDANAPGGSTIDPTSGQFSWTPSEAQGPGVYPITMHVTDNGSPALYVNQTFTVTVTEVNLPPSLASIPDQSVGEGNHLTFLAAASDPDLPANTLTFSLEAGAPDGATVDPASGQFSWTPSETQGPGVYPMTMRVTDNGSPALDTTRSFTITVNDVNLPPSLSHIPDQTVDEGNLLSFTAIASDPDFPANSLTFSLDDGAPAGATIDPNSGIFYWTPGEAQGPGIYPITVRVTDNGSPVLNTMQSFTITVNEVNQPPVINAGPDQAVSEGQTVAFTGSLTDPDLPPPLNGFAIQWDFGDGATAQGSLTANHAYGDNGVYTVTLTVDDGAGGLATDTLEVTVTNVAPSVEAGDNRTGFTDKPVRFSGSFTDPGTLDTHQIVWAFGDGGSSTGNLSPSHSFKLPGVYTVTLTVTDKDGAVGSDSLVVTVQQSTYSIYMPVMYHTGKPDLVGKFSLSPQKTTYRAGELVQITVVITNQGKGPTGSFWVDFYINPSHPPTGFNRTWDELCSLNPCFGIAWYIEDGLNPGESLTLTSTLDNYSKEHTYWPGWLASGASDLYLAVDSWNSTGSTGLVQELDETNNVTELHGLQVTGPNPPLGGPSPGIPSLLR